jgi:hypothetical protein
LIVDSFFFVEESKNHQHEYFCSFVASKPSDVDYLLEADNTNADNSVIPKDEDDIYGDIK